MLTLAAIHVALELAIRRGGADDGRPGRAAAVEGILSPWESDVGAGFDGAQDGVDGVRVGIVEEGVVDGVGERGRAEGVVEEGGGAG